MKLVKFTTAMSPHSVGEERVVPDDVAERLVKNGEATARPFPPPDLAPMVQRAVEAPKRPTLSLGRKVRRA